MPSWTLVLAGWPRHVSATPNSVTIQRPAPSTRHARNFLGLSNHTKAMRPKSRIKMGNSTFGSLTLCCLSLLRYVPATANTASVSVPNRHQTVDKDIDCGHCFQGRHFRNFHPIASESEIRDVPDTFNF